ncbi:MAG: hypothetical protein S4CHLAM102_00200 [Chlamydiia bacterium]|nr:hypothetical protein [Chlamydiia bacterium]
MAKCAPPLWGLVEEGEGVGDAGELDGGLEGEGVAVDVEGDGGRRVEGEGGAA